MLFRSGEGYDYNASNPPSLSEILRRWVKDGSKPREGKIIYYPLDEVYSIREYGWSDDIRRMSDKDWHDLILSMKKGGWDNRYPAILQFGKNNKMKVGEGNHRLAVAKLLEIRVVPVKFQFYNSVDIDLRLKYPESLKRYLDGLKRRDMERKKEKENRRKDQGKRKKEFDKKQSKMSRADRDKLDKQVDAIMGFF